MTNVSVIIPIFNHAEFVDEAIESVLQQEFPVLEVLCIDDGSVDGSLARATAFCNDPRGIVRVISQRNAGAHAALNRGALLARGDLLFFLNSDDRFEAHRIETFVNAWTRCGHPERFWGFSSVSYVDAEGQVVDPCATELAYLSAYDAHGKGPWVRELFSSHNVALTSGNLVVSRALFMATGGFREFRLVHDWDMALQMLSYVDPITVPVPLYTYRLHEMNTFRSISQTDGHREAERVRSDYAARLQARTAAAPYACSATPFVDFLATDGILRGGFTG